VLRAAMQSPPTPGGSQPVTMGRVADRRPQRPVPPRLLESPLTPRSGAQEGRLQMIRHMRRQGRASATFLALLLLGALVVVPTVSGATCGTLQRRIDAARAGSVLDLTGCTYTAGAILQKSLTIRGATIRVPAGERGLLVFASNVTLERLHVIGVQARTYVYGEVGVYIKGTGASPAAHVRLRNSVIERLGNEGVYLENVADAVVSGNRIRDIVYAGVMVVSGRGGHVDNNIIQRVGVMGSQANSGNAYGISLSRADGSLAAFPLTSDFTVIGNTVEDVPTWHALDTHGGQRITFSNNTVRRSPRAIFITADGSGRGSAGISVTNNRLGPPAPATTNLAAITTYSSVNVRITGNTASGWPRGKFFIDYLNQSTGLVVSGNNLIP
jgi:hypothetical protein